MVRDGSVVCPGSDAAVIRIKGDSIPPLRADMAPTANAATLEKYIAMTVDCNGTYVYLDPCEGGKLAVAEAARNLACSGATPLGVTDNLNFGNPHNPELFWQLKESVRGVGEACRAFKTPITGGNCSLYNQNPTGPIDPTPTIAMVGLIDDPKHITTQYFKDKGDAIILLGEVVDHEDPLQGLGGSAYLQVIHSKKTGTPPRCNLETAKTLNEALRSLIYTGNVKSAHDCSEGGLAVCLAECSMSHQMGRETPKWIGAQIDLTGVCANSRYPNKACLPTPRLDSVLFGESQNRVVITTSAVQADKVIAQAEILGVPAVQIGKVGGNKLTIKTAHGEFTWTVSELHDPWWNSIARELAAK
jgi:phosphoribosylformylglycinamidine synthase